MSDNLINELLRGTGPVAAALLPYQQAGCFVTGALDGLQVMEAASLQASRRELTFEDCAAFVYARVHSGILLTGDKPLRTFAHSQHLAVHGTLWVLDQLVETWQVLSPADGHRALSRIITPAAGRRLPATECATRLERWLVGETEA